MRILLVGINYAPDLIGVAKYNTELCESLVAEGHEVRVITAPPYYPAWRIPANFDSHYFRTRNANGVEITRTPIYVPRKPTGAKRLLHHASFALTSALPMLTKALEWRPDVMLSTAPSLMSSALVSFVARRIGVKSWLHVQDFEVDAAFDLGFLRNGALRRLMLGAESRILRSFDRVSSISPQMVDRLLAKGVPAERTVEIRNWIDTSVIFPRSRQTRYRHELGIGESDVVGLYSGTMSTKQGLDLVIDAASILQHSHPDIHFILAGEGPDKARLIKMAAGRSNVHFLGLQPNESFNELMATADVHLIPQKAEAADLVLPSKLGAVFGSARPVIAMATDGTGLAEEVKGAGMVVSPGDTHALADAICTLAQNQALCAAFGAEGRKRSLERWDRRAIVGRWALEMSAIRNAPSASETKAAMTARPPDAISVKDAIRMP